MDKDEQKLVLTTYAKSYGAAMAHRLFLHALVRALAYQGSLDLAHFIGTLHIVEENVPGVGETTLCGIDGISIGKEMLKELGELIQIVENVHSGDDAVEPLG